jgi:hypothetical protein
MRAKIVAAVIRLMCGPGSVAAWRRERGLLSIMKLATSLQGHCCKHASMRGAPKAFRGRHARACGRAQMSAPPFVFTIIQASLPHEKAKL